MPESRNGASKGPRPFDRGDAKQGIGPREYLEASKGPRPFDRGDVTCHPQRAQTSELQRGRDLSIAETPPARDSVRGGGSASKGPRPFDRGDCGAVAGVPA